MEDRCVCCGRIVPEGRQICPICEKGEKMTKGEAILVLSRHLMQCGMLMPIEWVQKNGEGSKFMQAMEMAIDAMKKGE